MLYAKYVLVIKHPSIRMYQGCSTGGLQAPSGPQEVNAWPARFFLTATPPLAPAVVVVRVSGARSKPRDPTTCPMLKGELMLPAQCIVKGVCTAHVVWQGACGVGGFACPHSMHS